MKSPATEYGLAALMRQHPSDSNLFALLDQGRRELGKHLDALGFGPVETPSRVVVSQPGITLKSYESVATQGVAVLLIPAPIKRAYTWDLAPWASVVRYCLDQGSPCNMSACWSASMLTSTYGQRSSGGFKLTPVSRAPPLNPRSGPSYLARFDPAHTGPESALGTSPKRTSA